MIAIAERKPAQPGGPACWEVTNGRDAPLDEILDWLGGAAENLERTVLEAGGVCLRGFDGIATAVDFAAVMAVIAPELMDYVGGVSPRDPVHGKIMSATKMAPEMSVPLHQEMAYTDGFPVEIAFFCAHAPAEGGETTTGDMRLLTRAIDPAVRERFARKGGVQLRRTLPSPDSLHKKPGGVLKSWHEALGTDDRATAERVAAARGWRADWLEDGSMQLWQEIRPFAIRHPLTGDEIYFNHVHTLSPYCTLEWARYDGRVADAAATERAFVEAPQMLDRMFHADGSEISAEDALYLRNLHLRFTVPHRWMRGDVLLLDNILFAHGRCAFAGEREIQVALMKRRAAAGARASAAYAAE